MDDMLQKYLKDKYGENYDQKAQEDFDSARNQNRFAQLGSDLGDAIAGQKVGSGDQFFQGLNKQAKENTVGKIEADKNQYVKGKKDAADLKDLMTREEIEMAQKDPNNRQSVIARALAKKYNLPVQDTDSYKDVSQFMDPKKMMETEAASNVEFEKQKQLRRMDQGFKEKENAMNRELELNKIAREESKKTDPRNLSGTDKARYDNALMTLKAIDGMGSALDAGNNTFSLIGDNDFTLNARDAAEAIGRMQSGGAIGKEEEARFIKMLPGSTDSKKMQREKLLKLRSEMTSRLNTLGFTPEKIGYVPKDFKYGSGQEKEADVEAYAKNHGISYDQALQVKNSRTSKAMR